MLLGAAFLLLVLVCKVRGQQDDVLDEPVLEQVHEHEERTVVIGDLHGDLESARHVLRMAGVLNNANSDITIPGDWPPVGDSDSDYWVGGGTQLVSLGDLFDRGSDSIEIAELLRRLQLQATVKGGSVVVLLGNHEVMNLMGDWRFVSRDELTRHGGVRGRAMRLIKEGDLGAWLREQKVAYIAGDALLTHAGVEPAIAEKLDVEQINEESKKLLDEMLFQWTPEELYDMDPYGVLGNEGVTWTRMFFTEWRESQGALEDMCESVAHTLRHMNQKEGQAKVSRMIIGHNVQQTGKVRVDCDGALISVDVAMSSAYGGLGLAAVVISRDHDQDGEWHVEVITPCHEASLLEGDAHALLQHKFECSREVGNTSDSDSAPTEESPSEAEEHREL